MATLFTDNFNRANGPVGNGWDATAAVVIDGNRVTSSEWGAHTTRDIGVTSGYRVSIVMSKGEWPFLLARYADWDNYYGVAWSSPNIELLRKQAGSEGVVQSAPKPAGSDVTIWIEVQQVGGVPQITWGHGQTQCGVLTDEGAGRPNGTRVGFLPQPGIWFDNFTVDDLATPGFGATTLTGTGTLTATGGDPNRPNPGTLTATPDIYDIEFSITGASAAAGIPTDPFAYRIETGGTWGEWAGWYDHAARLWHGLTPATTYRLQHKVRDLNGIEAEGAAVTVTTATAGAIPLPETIIPGDTRYHRRHHAYLHAERDPGGGTLPAYPVVDGVGHLAHHADLKTWHDAAHPGSPLPAVTSGATHAAAHRALHAWRNTPDVTPGEPGQIQAGAKSLLHPVYLNSGSVFQRDVRNMPLASNSAGIAANIRQQQINTGYYTGCSIWAYNFPSYAVDSRTTPMATVTWRNLRKWDWTPEDVMEAAFGQKPIPEWAVPAAGTDAALVVYDIATDTMWEYWQMIKTGPYQWAAEWGSRTLNANNNYSNQAGVGSLSASGLNGVLGQIGIGEVRAGKIDHAVIFACTGSGIGYSWPAKQSDGSSTDPNAPKQGQWGRLSPAFNVETLDNELLRLVGRAAQRYGIVPVDFAGSVSFCGESGAHEAATTGTNPWTAILANQGGGKADWEVLHGFPWEQTQWAPIDWGKP